MAIEQQSTASTQRTLVRRFGYGLLIGAGPLLMFGLGIVSLAIPDPSAAIAFALITLLSGVLIYVVSVILVLPLLAIPSTRAIAAGLIAGLVATTAAVPIVWCSYFAHWQG